MDNLFGMIRKNRIFGRAPEENNPYKVNFDDSTTNKDIVAGPQDEPHPMMDQYKSELNRMPTHDDYKPNVKGKIGAALAGFSSGVSGGDAYKATTSALDEPYREAEDEWSKRISRTGELASIEERTGAAKAKNTLDWAKYGDEHANSLSANHRRDVQNADTNDLMSLRGRTTGTNKITGTENTYDRNGNILFGHPVNETLDQTSKRHLNDFTNEENVRVKGDKDLAAYRGKVDENVHQNNETFDVTDPRVVQGKKDMESFKNDLAKGNIEFRASLTGTSPEQQNAQLAGAIEKAVIKNPAYKKFKDSLETAGAMDSNDPDYVGFQNEVLGNIGRDKNLPANPLTTKPGNSSKSKITRADILKEIKTQFPNNPEYLTNEKYIQDAMKANGAN